MRVTRVSVWDGNGHLYNLKSGLATESDGYVVFKVSNGRAESEGFVDRLPLDPLTNEWQVLASTSNETGYYEGEVVTASETEMVGGRQRRILKCEPSSL